jgi:hypothetical protein
MGIVKDKEDRKTAVFALFRDQAELERAIGALTAAGFASQDISALLPDAHATQKLAHEKHTKAPEGAAAGAAAGAVTGGALGLLIGLGAIVIPGLGALVAAGPIVAALAGAGAGGTVGSLTGALVGMGIPEYEAKRYEAHVSSGGGLLSVHCATKDDERRAKSILDGFGGHDIGDSREARAKGDDTGRHRHP